MNRQRGKQLMNGIFDEAMFRRIADLHTSASIVVLMHISIVVLTYCRIAKNKYFNKKARKNKRKSVNQ